MTCNCIDELNEQLKAKNTRISLAFRFGGAATPIIETEAITKRRGFKPLLAIPSYCPFCGTKYALERDSIGSTELEQA